MSNIDKPDEDRKKIISELIEVLDKNRNTDKNQNNKNRKFMFLVKSIVELVVIYFIMMMLTDNEKNTIPLIYFIFARQIYTYIEEFVINKK